MQPVFLAPCAVNRLFPPLQIFDGPRLKFSEIPQRLTNLLLPPDPIVINHVIRYIPGSLQMNYGSTEKELHANRTGPLRIYVQ